MAAWVRQTRSQARLRSGLASALGMHEIGVIAALAILIAVFSALAPTTFPTLAELGNILTVAAEWGIVAVGVTLLMIAGEFDLSVGSVFALSPLLMAFLSTNDHVNIWLAWVLSLLPAIGIGWLNGWITTHFGIPSFITTLGMLMWWKGVVLVATGGSPIADFTPTSLTTALGGQLGQTGLPASAIWFFAAVIIVGVILARSRFGNWVYASGGNPQAALAMGVPVRAVKTVAFIVAAFLAGFAGDIEFARLSAASPTAGSNLELTAIVVAVLGGTSLFGGVGTILGTMLGALMIGMLDSGLILIGAPSYWYTSFVGLILIIAVIINLAIRRRDLTVWLRERVQRD